MMVMMKGMPEVQILLRVTSTDPMIKAITPPRKMNILFPVSSSMVAIIHSFLIQKHRQAHDYEDNPEYLC